MHPWGSPREYKLNISLPNNDVILSKMYEEVEQANAVAAMLNDAFNSSTPYTSTGGGSGTPIDQKNPNIGCGGREHKDV